jgi:2'-5' RNA ligase
MSGSEHTERLFFALWPGRELAERVCSLGREIGVSGRRVPTANLHITLAFLGDIDTQRLEELIAVGNRLSREPFTLTLDRVGHWRRPGITWLGPSQTPQAATALHDNLQAELASNGFPTSERPFRPHVTLARKSRPPPAVRIEPLVWPVTRLVLVASRRDAEGSQYVVRDEWALSPGTQAGV